MAVRGGKGMALRGGKSMAQRGGKSMALRGGKSEAIKNTPRMRVGVMASRRPQYGPTVAPRWPQ